MYKVILVDDEIWVIRGLIKTIPWKEMGFEVVYYTTDSEKAKENIALLHPDVVITDIRMASVSGIDLLEHFSQEEETPEFVLISAYEEFDYAHKALKLGAFDYLIKPLKKSEVIYVLEKLKQTLEAKKDGWRTNIEKKILDQHEEISAANLFSVAGLERKGIYFRILCGARKFFDLHTMAKIFNTALEGSTVILEDSQFIYCIWNIPDGREQSILHALKEEASENMLFLGDGGRMKEEEMVYTYICQARCAALQFLVENTDVVSSYREECRLSKNDNFYHILREALGSGKWDMVLHLVQGLSEFIRKNHYTLQDLIGVGNYICINLTEPEDDVFQKLGIESVPGFLERYRDVEDYISDLKRVIKNCCPENELETVSVEEIIRYVDNHYTEKILVADIAQHFHVDLNYLSRLFKKKTGGNLKDYLTQKRLEKAKYLLDNTELKIYEISEASGYPDYFYFTRVFRRITGVTPSEWREERGKEQASK